MGKDLIDQEIREMLRKSAISVEKNLEGQFLSSMFSVKKNGEGGGRNRPVINLKELKKVVPLYTLQDGRSVSVERNATARGLYL